ncbi:MAG: hypothetical protein PVJ67_00935 [Candidatus Pacearchaeota archaeon]|jgi:hypothetical protein
MELQDKIKRPMNEKDLESLRKGDILDLDDNYFGQSGLYHYDEHPEKSKIIYLVERGQKPTYRITTEKEAIMPMANGTIKLRYIYGITRGFGPSIPTDIDFYGEILED